MSETKERVKGERIEGEIIFRDTYYIRPVSYHRLSNRSDQYGCSICEEYEIGHWSRLIIHQQKCEGKK